MLFCKNLEEIRWRRCGGISIPMPDKITSSETVAATAETVSPAVPSELQRKIYTIVKYGEPILEKPTAAITEFGPELEELTEDMFASMYAAQGVGLAAPQIGTSMRLTVVDVTGGKHPEGETREEEGCLSIPGFRGYVVRPQFVTVKAQNAKGETFEIRGEDLLARVFCQGANLLKAFFFFNTRPS